MNWKDRERKVVEALEAKLLAALESEPEEMRREDWDRLRAACLALPTASHASNATR